MKRAELQQLIEQVFSEVKAINATKGVEYATEIDALQNFKDGEDWGITPKQNLMVAMNKHYRSVQSYVKLGKVLSNENIEGRINDLILYGILLRGLIEEEKRPASTPPRRTILAPLAEEPHDPRN